VYIANVQSHQQSSEFNKRVGENLARFRKNAGLSQAELAQMLTDRGLPFQQQTVLKVEKGTRPLKFEEAHAIANLLEIPFAVLPDEDKRSRDRAIALSIKTAATAEIARLTRDVTRAQERITEQEEWLSVAERRLAEDSEAEQTR
jgi:transcriptional regulator with XRE-family HTH domain